MADVRQLRRSSNFPSSAPRPSLGRDALVSLTAPRTCVCVPCAWPPQGGVPNFKGFLVGNPMTWLTYTNYGMWHALWAPAAPSAVVGGIRGRWRRHASGLDPGATCLDMRRMDKLVAGLDPYGLDFPKCDDAPLANTRRHEMRTLAKFLRPMNVELGEYLYLLSEYQPCTADRATASLPQGRAAGLGGHARRAAEGTGAPVRT